VAPRLGLCHSARLVAVLPWGYGTFPPAGRIFPSLSHEGRIVCKFHFRSATYSLCFVFIDIATFRPKDPRSDQLPAFSSSLLSLEEDSFLQRIIHRRAGLDLNRVPSYGHRGSLRCRFSSFFFFPPLCTLPPLNHTRWAIPMIPFSIFSMD